MLEIKHRGPLTSKQVIKASRYLTRTGAVIETSEEKVVFFDTSIFPGIGDFATGFSRLSLKLVKDNAVLRIKDGNPSSPVRTKRAISFKKGDCPVIVYILHSLGLKNGFYRPAHRVKFSLQNVVISIKTACVIGNHFEVELTKGTTLEDSNIKAFLKHCSLYFWSEVQYRERIRIFIKKSPPIDILNSDIFEN